MKEPDELDYEKWLIWTQRTKVPGSAVREGRGYRKPAGRHPRKGFVHGSPPSRMNREEELLARIAMLEAQIAAEGG